MPIGPQSRLINKKHRDQEYITKSNTTARIYNEVKHNAVEGLLPIGPQSRLIDKKLRDQDYITKSNTTLSPTCDIMTQVGAKNTVNLLGVLESAC